jgi:hypothetical protein
MKPKNLSSCVVLLAIAACQPLASTASPAVTVNVTPSAVSNTYSGFITLQVAGLTNGETVVVQKFLDLNTNGVIDAGDWLVQQFNLTNLQPGMVIGGVGGIVNSNVPGDTGSTAGQITAQLNFQNGDFIQNMVGQYLYKVSSPGGHFTPITTNFNVTNFPFPQKLTGNVVSNAASTTVPNAVVLLFPAPRPGHNGPGGQPLAGVVANNAGGYTVQLPPGTYVPMAAGSNYVANYSASPVLTLTNGATITTNLALTNATASITGRIVDANNASLGLPGVFMPASANGLITVTFSDTNGNFTMPVTAGQWAMGSEDVGLLVHGYVGWNNDTNVNAGGAVTLAYPQATALFYGSVKDNLGNHLPGIDVEAYDNNNLYDTDGYSDANGKYVVGVLGLSSDPWQVSISSKSGLASNYIFSQPDFDSNNGTNLSVGAAVKVSFTAVLATNQITGSLKDSSGNAIGGVGIWANATISGVDYSQYVDTGANGNYSMNVANGTWTVGVSSGGGGDSLPGNYLAPANQTVVISNNNATVNFTTLLPGNQISGWLKDNSGHPISGVMIWASATISNVGYFQYMDTDTNGNYSIGVVNGSWNVGVETGAGSEDSLPGNYLSPASQTVVVSNNNVTVDFTALLATNQISGWLKDNSGNPIAGVGVWAYATIGSVNYNQGNVNTGASGNYSLNVVNGTWTVGLSTCGECGDTLPADYLSPPSQSVVVSNNNATANFTAPLATNSITGSVTDNNGNPISGVGVWANATINSVDYSQYADTDGSGSYSLSVANGSWSVGLNCNGGDDGLLNLGNYQCPNNQTITIANTNGLANFAVQTNVNVGGTLQVTTAALPNGTVGVPYDQQLTADGGNPSPSYSWSVYSGSLLPGLSLDGGGTIQGTPTLNGTNKFTVQVSDNNGSTATQALTLTIYSGVLQVTTTSLPSGTTNVPYNSQQLTASGGHPPYNWSLALGALPSGLSLSTNGVISGTPTTAGTNGFVVRVTDSVAATATQALSLVVYTFSTSVTFSVTPSAVSNFYTGIITLQVGGLISGETVLVQKYRDVNGNGVIDAGDTEVQQFQLTDGQASVFYDGTTAVTNFNVPGDLTPADGAITAQLHLALSGASQLAVAQYAFRLSSPIGRFAPVTNLFNVTNSAFAQSFTGNVVCNGTNVPHALAYLFSPPLSPSSTLIAGTLADVNGAYRLSAPPGNYALCAFKSGFVANSLNAPVLALGANSTITTNLSLLLAPYTISGQFVDAANTNAGLPLVKVDAGTANGLVTVGWADGDGNFSLGVTTNWWVVLGDSQNLDSQGYLGLQSPTVVNAIAGSVAGVTIPLARGTALVYGTVKDEQNRPLAGVRLSGQQNDGGGPYVGDATTDQNGNYAMAVSSAGVWNVSISANNPAFPYYAWSAGLGDTALATGQAVRQDFVGTATVQGLVLTGPGWLGNGEFQFTFDTASNVTYTIQYSIALTNWISVLTFDGDGGPLTIIDPTVAGTSRRFYRVKIEP